MKKKYVMTGVIVILSALLAYMQFIHAKCSADDAGSYIYMYNFFELGNKNLDIRMFLNPWFYCSALAYLLNIGGNGAFSSNAYTSIWYGIAVFFTLKMVMHGKESRWPLALAVFILLPYGRTNKYHMVAAFVTLFAIWALQCYTESRKKWILWCVGLAAVYTFLFTDDRLLFILFFAATLLVYYVILLFQDKKKRRYLYLSAFVIILAAGLVKAADVTLLKLLGNGLGITEEMEGYGGAGYFTWINVDTLFNKGIPSLFDALLAQWNVPVKGGIIQFNSFYWIIRMLIAGLGLVALAVRWKEIIKKGITSLELLDSLAVICTTIVLGINILNGMIEYYSISAAPVNRYASVCWFLLVVILARWLDGLCSGKKLYNNISNDLFLGTAFVLLILGYADPVFLPSEDVSVGSCEVELNFLREHGQEYKYGIGSHWKSTPVTAATNAEYVVCKGWIGDDGFEYGKSDGFYKDGGNYFNFIVSDISNEMTISPENIENLRGDYVDIYSNADTIYMYDYDIRFDPVIVMDTAGVGYELTDTIVYNLNLPVGSNRIEITTPEKDNLLLEVADNDDITDVKIGSKGDNLATVEVTCLQNTQIALTVGRREDVTTELYKIEIKRTAGAVDVDVRQTEIPLKEGRYIVTFSGEHLKKMEVNWTVDGEVTQLTDGRIKRRYLVEVSKTQNVGYEIISNGANISTIYYENEKLFGEE